MSATNHNATPSLANATDIRDIAPPVEIYGAPTWLWWGIGAIVILAILSWIGRLVILLLEERRKAKSHRHSPLPHQLAKQALNAALSVMDSSRRFGIAVSDAIRQYLEQRFNYHAPERTTEEFLAELRGNNLLSPGHQQSLGMFLSQCDVIKFSKYEPTKTELQSLHASALALVEDTQEIRIQADRNPEDPERLHKRRQVKRMAIIGCAIQIFPVCWTLFFGRAVPEIYQLLTAVAASAEFSWFNLTDLKHLFLTYNAMLDLIFPYFLTITLIACAVGLSGWILMALSLRSYRAEWFCWSLVAYSTTLLCIFPIGSGFAVYYLLYIQNHRSEFFQRRPVQNSLE
jgi:hypothetical protein